MVLPSVLPLVASYEVRNYQCHFAILGTISSTDATGNSIGVWPRRLAGISCRKKNDDGYWNQFITRFSRLINKLKYLKFQHIRNASFPRGGSATSRAGMRDFLPAPSRQSASAASGARATRFADEPRRTMSAPGRRPCASPARDVEHSAYATASRPPLFASPHPTALRLHAATAHTDRRRMGSCRTQKLPRTDPPIQCIDLKLTGA